MESIALTTFSSSSGCGCKIAPAVLHEIIAGSGPDQCISPHLLVGNESMDDAAVYELDEKNVIISTVDFFTPIVNDPFDFGRVAAANALSDVYAMGGKPVFANALLGWPVDVLGADTAARVLAGAKSVCAIAGIPIAGGHSIAIKEPVFGLAVNGIAVKSQIKRNSTAHCGDKIYLTKPLGTGILSSALKKEKIKEEDEKNLIQNLVKLNDIGMVFSELNEVHALTDVTGFGLLGHVTEMADSSGLTAVLGFGKIPVLSGIENYIGQFIFPDNVWKNWNAYEKSTKGVDGTDMVILCDPQTSGGLLVAVEESYAAEFELILRSNQSPVHCIGEFIKKQEESVQIIK